MSDKQLMFDQTTILDQTTDAAGGDKLGKQFLNSILVSASD